MLADPTKLFDTRVPNQEALFCMDSTAYTVFKRYVEEKDLICSFEYDGDEGFVYVQSNPAKCIGSELTPVYDVHKAEFFVNGLIQSGLHTKAKFLITVILRWAWAVALAKMSIV